MRRCPAVGMEFFEQQWASYRAIVDHDLMEHRALTRATAAAIDAWLDRRPWEHPGASPPTMVDLGCGDLALLAPWLRRLPLASYRGLDLTAEVLPRAQAALGPVPYPHSWQQGDLLTWASQREEECESVDILHSAFAIHHLSDADKALFLRGARQRLSPKGLFLWADVFRLDGESRGSYLERTSRRVHDEWQALTPCQQEQTLRHIRDMDQPAERQTIAQEAEAAGWRWQWLWQGRSGSEALALLQPD